MQDSYSPYPRPEMDPEPAVPPVVNWYKVYCGFMAGVYLLVALFMLAFPAVLMSALRTSPQSARNAREMGGLEVMAPFWIAMAVLCLVFAVPFLLPLFLKRAAWLWIYGIVLIALGMTSVCTLPFCIPLIIFWVKDDVKAYYGRA